MSNITIKMFGEFNASTNGKTIVFQYKKVEALFCYLVLKKHATRDELSNLLWSEREESTAKKNLRNAIYKLKECFEERDNLFRINKSAIEINPDLNISIDIEMFLNDESAIDIYQGSFLQNYSIKDADNFEVWVLETREYLKDIYLKRLNERIEIEKGKGNYEEIEKYCKLIIKIDEFDENAYRNLIHYYKLQGKFNNGLELYDRLSDILEKELSITPEIETERVFSEFLSEMHKRHNYEKDSEFFYGRKKELEIIDENYKKFIEGKWSKSILIKGEMGIGKTCLKNKSISNLNDEDVYVIEDACYQFEKENIFKAWKNITISLLQITKRDNIKVPSYLYNVANLYKSELIDDYNIQDLKLDDLIDVYRGDIFEDLIFTLLNIVSERKKLIIVFEDIQWMDVESISLLIGMLSRSNQQKIKFVLTCRNEIIYNLNKLFIFSNNIKKIETIELFRYTKCEVEGFINKALTNTSVSREVLDKIYLETEGNTFFLTEYLNVLNSKKNINIMTSKMHDIIASKFVDMSKEEKKISEITSLFDDGAPLFIFKELLQKDELEILDLIENLEKRFILEEITNNDNLVWFKFTHRKLCEFQYMSLSNVRKSVLHNKVGKLIEERLSKDSKNIDIYYKLIYHYKNANNDIDYLKYEIKLLNVYLNFSHERFPVLDFDYKFYNKFDFNDKRTRKKINEIDDLLEKVKVNREGSIEVLSLEMAVLHIKGRYFIRRGIYEEGLKLIKNMMEVAQDVGNSYYLIEGCKQITLYCIQVNSTDMMLKYINYGYELAKEQKSTVNTGIFLRFEAVNKEMTGEYETAEKLIEECIDLLRQSSKSSSHYVLHIAACYDEMGDIKRKKGEFLEALMYYEKAITLCEQKNSWISISLFYTHAGEIAYWLEKYDVAKEYFEKAMKIFNKIEYNAGEPIAEAYMSLILLKEGNLKSSFKLLKKADVNAQILKNPKEIGTVLRVMSEFRFYMGNDVDLNDFFKDYLSMPIEHYVQEGIKILAEAKEDYQISVLKEFIK